LFYSLKIIGCLLVIITLNILLPAPLAGPENNLWWKPIYDNGIELIQKNDLTEAELKFRKIIALNKKIPEAYYGLGVIYNIKNPGSRKSANFFRRAIQLNKNFARAYYQMGMVHKNRQNQIIDARNYFEKAVSKDPTLFEAWLEIGEANKSLDMPELTFKAYSRAVIHNPENLHLFNQFMETAMWLGEENTTVETIQFLMNKYPQNPLYSYNLAHFYYKLGYFQWSIQLLDSLKNEHPGYFPYKINFLLSKNYFNIQNSKHGLTHYWQAVESIQDSAAREEFLQDISYIITESEYRILQSLPMDSLNVFYKRFWRSRDPNLATLDNERIPEHYQRLTYARKYFRRYNVGNNYRESFFSTLHPYAQYNVQGDDLLKRAKFPEFMLKNREIDDLGLIYIRHGNPDEQVTSVSGMPNYIQEDYVRLKQYMKESKEEYLYGSKEYYFSVLQKRREPASMYFSDFTQRVPRPDMGENLLMQEYFDNLPMNISWKYYKKSNHEEMIFHFKKYGENLGWIIETIPYAIAERENLDNRYSQLGMASFEEYPNIITITELCKTLNKENIKYVLTGLQTETSNFKLYNTDLKVPYQFLAFKGENHNTDLELYYLIEGRNTILNVSEKPNSLQLSLFVGLYDEKWDPAIRIKKSDKLPVNFSQTEWKGHSIARMERLSTRPGQFTYELQFNDTVGHKLGIYKNTLKVPDYYLDTLLLSDVILSEPITTATVESNFRKRNIVYAPHMFNAFENRDTIGLYFEIYNLILDSFAKTNFEVSCSLQSADYGIESPKQILFGFFKSILGFDMALPVLHSITAVTPGTIRFI